MLTLKAHDIAPESFRILSRTNDFPWVLFQNLDPARHIGMMLARIMADAQISAQHVAGNLCPQLFPRVSFAAKGVLYVTVKPALMP